MNAEVVSLGVMVPDIVDNVKLCICPGCPTFKESHLSGLLFCARGKAKETVNQKGCLCMKCPVTKKYKLEDEYYCQIGKSADV
jgi:hypothetical protein